MFSQIPLGQNNEIMEILGLEAAVYLKDKAASVTVIGRSETVLQEVMGQKVGRRVQKVENCSFSTQDVSGCAKSHFFGLSWARVLLLKLSFSSLNVLVLT